MKLIETIHAAGTVLCHDLTRIVPGEMKGVQFRKGHVVTQEDIPVLLSMGKDHLYVWEADAHTVHENDAAERLCRLCKNEFMHASEVKEGKMELIADCDGLLRVDAGRLLRVNSIEDIIIATRHNGTAVKKGDRLCGMRILPLFMQDSELARAQEAAGKQPLMTLTPFRTGLKAGLVITGSEVYFGRIEDRFKPVIEKKLAAYGIGIVKTCFADDVTEHITAAIAQVRDAGADLVICTGGMSVDPDDLTPAAIRASGASIVTKGAPLLPGCMFMLGYYADGVPVAGLPGSVMYMRNTSFDIFLPWLAAGVPVTRGDVVKLGCGGYCLNCEVCTFPNCGFGKA